MKWLFSDGLGWFDFGALGLAFLIAMFVIFRQGSLIGRQQKQVGELIDKRIELTVWIYVYAERLGLKDDQLPKGIRRDIADWTQAENPRAELEHVLAGLKPAKKDETQ